jgi:hypothetical protein
VSPLQGFLGCSGLVFAPLSSGEHWNPGNANLQIGDLKDAIRENGVPGQTTIGLETFYERVFTGSPGNPYLMHWVRSSVNGLDSPMGVQFNAIALKYPALHENWRRR